MSRIPPPFRYNRLKHQAPWLARQLVDRPGLFLRWPEVLLALGRSQFDTYFGALPTRQILQEISDCLQKNHHWQPQEYLPWVAQAKGYRLLHLSDGSRWVLRAGERPLHYIHLHPARYSLYSHRIKASVYKTLIYCLAWEQEKGSWPMQEIQNQFRTSLNLPPLSKKHFLGPEHPHAQELRSLF